MYHSAHWRCEPAQAERINVEDLASRRIWYPGVVRGGLDRGPGDGGPVGRGERVHAVLEQRLDPDLGGGDLVGG